MRSLIFVFFLIIPQLFWSQVPDQLFEQANVDFRNGKFDAAITKYLEIEKSGFHSADLYYNLGNSYYKLNKIAPSIYYFEKALILNSQHEDAKNNLAFAQRMTIDIIEPMPTTFFQRINEVIIYPISPNAWAWISVVLAFFSAGFFITYYFSDYSNRKKVFFVLSIISMGLFLLVLSLGIKAKHHSLKDQPAIVYVSQASVKSEPGTGNTEVFALHEGTKVQVIDQEGNWFKIKLADGKMGWIIQDKVRKLK
jgi:tetratricopeptide (TPR) repeat protein